LAITGIALFGYRGAIATPLVRHLVVTVPDYPGNEPPIRIVVFSDLHVHGPDMSPERASSIVDQINSLHPDIVLFAGDLGGDLLFGKHYSPDEAAAPLGQLKARLGVYAVLGNNDYRVEEVRRALGHFNVRVLMNEASQAGPIALGGLDGRLAHSPEALDVARQETYNAMRRTAGIKLLVAHRPDEFVPAPAFISLVVAGHTHCGQIVLPLLGALLTGSDYGRKYLCGVYREGSRLLVVTAGVGTSHVPVRIGAPPDIWLITMKGANDRSATKPS
jgi:predicted MPP superfamily phosphohydrolase